MPEERLFTIRGKAPAAATHRKLQLSSYDPTHQYLVVDFQIRPAGAPTQSNCYGILSLGRDDTIDPRDPNFGNSNQIGWARSSVCLNPTVPVPGVAESIQTFSDSVLDDMLFAYDLWLHTMDDSDAEEINYMVKIMRYKTSATAGSISSLRQYLVNTA